MDLPFQALHTTCAGLTCDVAVGGRAAGGPGGAQLEGGEGGGGGVAEERQDGRQRVQRVVQEVLRVSAGQEQKLVRTHEHLHRVLEAASGDQVLKTKHVSNA